MKRRAIVCCWLGASVFGMCAFAQQPQHIASNDRTISVERERGNILDPARIVRYKIDGLELPPWPQTTHIGDNWLKNMSVVVRNGSNKTIVAASVRVLFHGRNTARPAYFPVYAATALQERHVGHLPEHQLYDRSGKKLTQLAGEPIAIRPGQELDIPVAPDSEALRKLIEEQMPVSSVTTCGFSITSVYFDDGTKWSYGGFYRPDLATPGKYVRISFQEFSGTTEDEFRREEMRRLAEDEQRDTQAGVGGSAGAAPNASPLHSCRTIDPAAIMVADVDGAFAVRDANGVLFECGTDRATVQQIFDVVQHYRIDSVCSIESPQTFRYMTAGGAAPSGEFVGEDCLRFNLEAIKAVPHQGRWVVTDGRSQLYRFATESAAQQAVQQIQKYRFNRDCFVGRGTFGIPRRCRPIGYLRK